MENVVDHIQGEFRANEVQCDECIKQGKTNISKLGGKDNEYLLKEAEIEPVQAY